MSKNNFHFCSGGIDKSRRYVAGFVNPARARNHEVIYGQVLSIPSVGYGLRYEFGIFTQSFKEGWQVESADQWLHLGNPWEFPQPDNMVEVRFGGYTHHYTDRKGRYRVEWKGGQTIFGQSYHLLTPGYKTNTVNMLRLWQAKASQEFDFQLFDTGNYTQAIEHLPTPATLCCLKPWSGGRSGLSNARYPGAWKSFMRLTAASWRRYRSRLPMTQAGCDVYPSSRMARTWSCGWRLP